MARKQLCAFGKEINHALVELNQPKEWLIEQVGKSTGRYFDRSYLHKIQVGELTTHGTSTYSPVFSFILSASHVCVWLI